MPKKRKESAAERTLKRSSGMAGKAARRLGGRRRSIDDAIGAATGGEFFKPGNHHRKE